MDITTGTWFYARFARPSSVIAGLEMVRASFDYDVTVAVCKKRPPCSAGRPLRLFQVTISERDNPPSRVATVSLFPPVQS